MQNWMFIPPSPFEEPSANKYDIWKILLTIFFKSQGCPQDVIERIIERINGLSENSKSGGTDLY